MSRIAWSGQMSVGVPEIDRQHMRLVDLFNGLEEALVRRSASRILRGLFAELSSYTRYHFATEANILRMDENRGLHAHLEAHDGFVTKLSELEPLLQWEGADTAAMETSRFLRSWILRHIIVADRLAFTEHRLKPAAEKADADNAPSAAREPSASATATGPMAGTEGRASSTPDAPAALPVASK
jgi:hemerythrin